MSTLHHTYPVSPPPSPESPIILVFYYNTKQLNLMDLHEIENFKDRLLTSISEKPGSEKLMTFLIPTSGETRIECVNPVLVGEAQYNKTKQVLGIMQEVLKNFF